MHDVTKRGPDYDERGVPNAIEMAKHKGRQMRLFNCPDCNIGMFTTNETFWQVSAVSGAAGMPSERTTHISLQCPRCMKRFDTQLIQKVSNS